MLNRHTQFINGSWYEREYQSRWYRHQYIESSEPQWSKECSRYCVDMTILYLGLDTNMKVLDLGSGVGRQIRAWRSRGFNNIKGIEISQTAIEYSGERCIVCGNVLEMPFESGEFDLIFSNALLEHIAPEIEDKVIKECLRVGKMQAHFPGMDFGTDPSHINIKTINEWLDLWGKHTFDPVFSAPGLLLKEAPAIFALPATMISHPLESYFKTLLEAQTK